MESLHTTQANRSCAGCTTGTGVDPFTFAFQPIVDVEREDVFAYEALVRGPNGEGAPSVLGPITEANRYAFDQACRVRAIETAARLNIKTRLSINFLPNAVYRPEVCIRTTLAAAHRLGFPIDRLMFEAVESEHIEDKPHLADIIRKYRSFGFSTAIDDFGAGFAGLALLAEFQPDYIKLDISLIRDIDQSNTKRAIVRGIISVCSDLGIVPIAEGIETKSEYQCLRDAGISLFQGFLFARPGFESLPLPDFKQG